MRKFYRHYKGGLYELICFAELEKDKTKVVIYRSLTYGFNRNYVRPFEEFNEKFTLLTDEEFNKLWNDKYKNYARSFKDEYLQKWDINNEK